MSNLKPVYQQDLNPGAKVREKYHPNNKMLLVLF